MPRTRRSPHGFTVMVGKHPRDSDRLTLHVAKPHDFWLQVMGVPGMQVIMQWNPEKTAEPQLEDFRFAASMAAFHSDISMQPNALVRIACVRDVQKPKGSKPNSMICDSFHTMMIENPLEVYDGRRQKGPPPNPPGERQRRAEARRAARAAAAGSGSV